MPGCSNTPAGSPPAPTTTLRLARRSRSAFFYIRISGAVVRRRRRRPFFRVPVKVRSRPLHDLLSSSSSRSDGTRRERHGTVRGGGREFREKGKEAACGRSAARSRLRRLQGPPSRRTGSCLSRPRSDLTGKPRARAGAPARLLSLSRVKDRFIRGAVRSLPAFNRRIFRRGPRSYAARKGCR